MTKKQWSAQEKTVVVLDLLKGTKTKGAILKEYGLCESVLYRWREQALEGMAVGFENKRGAMITDKQKDAEIERLHKIIGQQTVVIDYQKKIAQGISR